MKTIIKTISLVLLNITIANAQIIQKWLQLGPGTSKNLTSQPSMAFDRNGNLFLAFTDQSSPQNKATLKKFDGQTWTTLSSQFTPGQAQFVTLELDTAGIPHVAFQEPNPVTKKITVMKFNGTGWDTIGARGFATADFNNPELSFVIDQNNNLHLAYRENSTGKASLISHYGINWQSTNSTNITEGDATKLALSVRGSFTYLAFNNGYKNGKLSVITQTLGGSWVYVGDSTLSNGAVDYINCRRLVSQSAGYHAVTYKDLGDGKAYYKTKLDNAIWSNSMTFSDGLANYVTLGLKRVGNFDGHLYCGYADGTSSGNATVRKIHVSVSTSSSTVGKQGFTDTLGIFAGAYYATLGIDKQDSLYMAVQSMNEYVVFKYRNVNTDLTGILENQKDAVFTVFPNPSSGEISFKTGLSGIGHIKILGVDGKILFEKNGMLLQDAEVNISSFAPGIYFVELETDDQLLKCKLIRE